MNDLIVIDDESIITRFISKICLKNNINCLAFNETRSFIEYLEKNNVTPKNYLIDMRLVDDLDGPENLYFYLKKKEKLTNFTFMTGHFQIMMRACLRELALIAYLSLLIMMN